MIEASPCDHRRLLGHARYTTAQERDWYERHEPWLRDQLEHGSTKYADEPAYIVHCALGWLNERAAPGREPRWEELDVRDLLLSELPMGGLLSSMGSREVLIGLKEFIAWMGQHQKLAAGAAARLVQQVDDCQEQFLDYFGDTRSRPLHTPLERRLAELKDLDQAWLYCAHCNRFFQVKDLRVDFLGNRQGCAFSGCGGAGFDVDILRWDAHRNNRDPRWPSSPDQLRRGMSAPEGKNLPLVGTGGVH